LIGDAAPDIAASDKEAAVCPVPASDSEAELPGVADATRLAVRDPMPVGLNVTPTEQLIPAGRLSGQFDEAIMKSPALVPVVVTESAVVVPAAIVPIFEIMNVCGALLPETTVLGKVTSVDGLIDSVATHPVFAPGTHAPL
jgi:hypothetical protein